MQRLATGDEVVPKRRGRPPAHTTVDIPDPVVQSRVEPPTDRVYLRSHYVPRFEGQTVEQMLRELGLSKPMVNTSEVQDIFTNLVGAVKVRA